MTIDAALGKQARWPFDYCITEKAALLAGLRSAGRSFQHDEESSQVYVMPLSLREGVCSRGVYYWHDYPLASRNCLNDDWRASVPVVNEKYDFLWRRFLDELARPGEILFIVGTTQDNLPEFASDDDDFQRKFAIDGAFIDELADALRTSCTDQFSILALVRSFREADSIRTQCRFNRVNARFCGALSLPTHQLLAKSLEDLTRPGTSEALRLLEGEYDNGALIKSHSHDVARIYRVAGKRVVPWAECYASSEGYLVNFSGRRDSVFKASFEDQRLKFSNGSVWSKR
jgi:hypothetical protein